jgi:hypothetical protein
VFLYFSEFEFFGFHKRYGEENTIQEGNGRYLEGSPIGWIGNSSPNLLSLSSLDFILEII